MTAISLIRFCLVVSLGCLLLGVAACGDDCEDVDCLNGGTCVEGSCECPEDFVGEQCEFSSARRFVGNYLVDYDCQRSGPEHRVIVSVSPDDNAQLIFTDLGDLDCGSETVAVIGTLAGNTLTIEEQTFCADLIPNGYTFSGTGEVGGNSITLNFSIFTNVDDSPRTLACQATLEKE
ncbi:MAG: hypothetical protein AAGI38_24470 [Bacteroidota bacterium]